jgi:hypothetical protein
MGASYFQQAATVQPVLPMLTYQHSHVPTNVLDDMLTCSRARHLRTADTETPRNIDIPGCLCV